GAFGQAGLGGVKRALDKRKMELAAEGTFERNTVAVKGALLTVRRAQPDAVIMIAPYKPAAQFIKLAREIKFDATCVNISFVGSDALTKELGGGGEGTVVTQVVPFPQDTSIPVVARYQAALKASAPDAQPGFISLEGYLVGRAIVAVLEKIDGEPTRKAFVEAVQKSGGFDLGGFRLAYGPSNNRGSSEVYLTEIEADGSFKPVTSLAKTKFGNVAGLRERLSAESRIHGAGEGTMKYISLYQLGLRGRLFAAFGAVAAITVLASAIAFVSYDRLGRSLEVVTGTSLPHVT